MLVVDNLLPDHVRLLHVLDHCRTWSRDLGHVPDTQWYFLGFYLISGGGPCDFSVLVSAAVPIEPFDLGLLLVWDQVQRDWLDNHLVFNKKSH